MAELDCLWSEMTDAEETEVMLKIDHGLVERTE